MNLRYVSIILIIIFSSCQREINRTEGWDYYEPSPKGGFQRVPFVAQETAPGMILVEGGRYHLPELYDTNTIDISTFYLSKYEETNGQYLEYLNFLKKYYSEATYQNALPDTTVWDQLEVSERTKSHFVEHYLRDWTYEDYPVVGVSLDQIERYATWKTDRINEMILIREGVLSENQLSQDSSDVFTTRGYFGTSLQEVRTVGDLEENGSEGSGMKVRFEDGILLPKFRLPTENEWKLAHLGMGDIDNRYLKTEKARRIKLNEFHFLEDVERMAKKSYPPEVKLDGLQKVYALRPNVYDIKGLNTNVAEYVADSTSVAIIGGSFVSTRPDHSAVYDEKSTTGDKYRFNSSPQKSIKMKSNETGIYGFRLAMDCTMKDRLSYYSSGKRYRYRPK